MTDDKRLEIIFKKIDEFNTTGDVPPVDTPFAFGKKTSKEKGSREGSRYIGKKFPKEKIKSIKNSWYMKVDELTTDDINLKIESELSRIFDDILDKMKMLKDLVDKTPDKTILKKMSRQYDLLDSLVNHIGYDIIKK